MSSRRAWCQSRLNSSCSRASPSVKLNISLRRWTPRTVCTARLGRPLSAQYIGAKSSSSIRGSASFRKTSAQLPSRRLAFFGVTRNWDCQRLSCGSRARNMLPSLARALPQRPFPTLSSHCPRRTRSFYEGIRLERILLNADVSAHLVPYLENVGFDVLFAPRVENLDVQDDTTILKWARRRRRFFVCYDRFRDKQTSTVCI